MAAEKGAAAEKVDRKLEEYFLLIWEMGDHTSLFRVPVEDFKRMFEKIPGKDATYQFTQVAIEESRCPYGSLDTYMCSYQLNHARSMWRVGEHDMILKGVGYWHDNT